MIKIV